MFKQIEGTLDRKDIVKKALPQLLEDYSSNVEVEFAKEEKAVEFSHVSKDGKVYNIKDSKEVEVLTVKIGRFSICRIELTPKSKDGKNYCLVMNTEFTGTEDDGVKPKAVRDLCEFISILYCQSVTVLLEGKELEFNNHLKDNSNFLDNLINYYLN